MTETIPLLLIPYAQSSILVPKNLIEYILPYAPPLPTEFDHEALIGSLIYKNAKVPIVDLAKLDSNTKNKKESSNTNKRIVIVSSILDESPYDSYAIVAHFPPRIVNLQENMIEEVEENFSDLFYSYVRLGNDYSYQYSYVPYLERIEKLLFGE